ncbi:MAG: hypothetical protein LIO55_08235 [Oscillospiraceae bacterium]|nr:hypothetical protein [Oscillospiraceae bacterium]
MGLRWVYVYDMDIQRGEQLRTDDGISWYFQQSNGEYVYGIGISIQALEQGRDYTVELFIHELTHCYTNEADTDGANAEHGKDFDGTLDKLLKRYNRICGTALKAV